MSWTQYSSVICCALGNIGEDFISLSCFLETLLAEGLLMRRARTILVGVPGQCGHAKGSLDLRQRGCGGETEGLVVRRHSVVTNEMRFRDAGLMSRVLNES